MKIIFFIIISIICTSSIQQKAPLKQPNVIFILTDDQGYGDLSLHGNPYLQTPNIDAIAREGVQFNRFFVSPLCAPSRSSFMTGKYHLRTGVVSVSNGLEVMNTNELTFAELFKQNGYRTGIFGKWHNGEYTPNDPNSQGFDEFLGFSAGHWMNYFDSALIHNGTPEPTKGFITDILTDKAIQFINKNKNQPFFCYIPYNAPHGPYQVPDKYFAKFKKKGLDNELSAIYGMVENVDENIGRILKNLENQGLMENTIIVFATDNGPQSVRYNAGMKGKKGSVDEGGVRVPFFIKWKGKIKPKVLNNIATHIDFLPTIADLANISLPQNHKIDGRSLTKSILEGREDSQENRMIFSHVAFLDKTLYSVPASVRTQQYRWVKVKNEVSLFDMQKDSLQIENIASKYPEIAQNLEKSYNEWFAEVSKDISLAARPIPLGYSDKKVILQAHDAGFSGNIKFKEGHGWAHDWLTNWNSKEDKIWWDVEVKTAGKYHLSLQYTSPEEAKDSEFIIKIQDKSLIRKLSQSFNPPMKSSPDRVLRIESYDKDWAIFPMGILELPAGKNRIELNCTNLKSSQVADIKGLVVGRLK
jgi:arylsulfatase A-like enzyme